MYAEVALTCAYMERYTVRRILFYFLVYGSSDPNFWILEKKNNIFLTFFIFSDLKKKIKC